MNTEQSAIPGLALKALSRYLIGLAALAAILFLPAGTLSYWQAWVYLAILFIPMAVVLVWLARHHPDLLERRLRMREREGRQKRIIGLAYVWFVVTFILPGLDVRFGWSATPAAVSIAADGVVLAGYVLFVLVLRENAYASRIIEVEQRQKVITTGPYALVRHPMYLGVALLYCFSPLALGPYWAMIPAALMIVILVARIRNEESVLLTGLEGYQAYARQTRYRLLPGVW